MSTHFCKLPTSNFRHRKLPTGNLYRSVLIVSKHVVPAHGADTGNEQSLAGRGREVGESVLNERTLTVAEQVITLHRGRGDVTTAHLAGGGGGVGALRVVLGKERLNHRYSPRWFWGTKPYWFIIRSSQMASKSGTCTGSLGSVRVFRRSAASVPATASTER